MSNKRGVNKRGETMTSDKFAKIEGLLSSYAYLIRGGGETKFFNMEGVI